MSRIIEYNPDGRGDRPHRAYDLSPVLAGNNLVPYDYWKAVTDVACPVCDTGVIRWAEAGYVPGYRICDGCDRHFMARGTARQPYLIRIRKE